MFKGRVFLEIVIALMTTLMAMVSPSSAKELSGDEIVLRADRVMIGNAARYDSTMVIKRPGLEDVVSKFRTYFKERGEKVLIRVKYPPEEVGKDLLLVGDNMWQYVPNVEKSVRVAGSQRYMGGEFNNSDLLKVSLVNDYKAKLIEIVETAGGRCYFLELKAKRPSAPYDSLNYWVRVDGFLPYREEYITLSGKKLKSLTYSNIGELGGRTRPKRLTMINSLRPDHQTIMDITKGDYNAKISESIFTRTYLEKAR